MNIYIISAFSYRIIDDEVKKIVKNNNYLTMNLNRITIPEVLQEASYYSIDSDKKYIVVSNAYLFGNVKTDDKYIDELINYLNNPNPNTILIFTTLNGIDLRKKITKIIKDKYKLINILPMDRKTLFDFIKKEVEKNKYIIDYDSINYLINNSYDNLDIILNELDKIYLYYNKPCKILLEDIEKIVGSAMDNNNFHFVSSVIEKNLSKSLYLFKDLKVYKVEPIVLINLLAREYRLMYYLKKYQKNRLSMKDICIKLNLQEWQVNKLYNNSLKYREKELKDNLKTLANIDLGIKSGKLDKDIALISFMIEACE